MRFSASRMKLWQDCALAAHYRYDQKLPTRVSAKLAFGSIIHLALKYLNDTNDYPGAVKRFKEMWSNPDSVGLRPDWWPRQWSYATLMAKGIDILEHVNELHRWQDRVILGAELPFLVKLGDHELTGYIDLLEIERSGTGHEVLKVVDYKTATRDPSRAVLALDLQFTSYLYAVNQKEFWTGVPGNPDYPGLENGEWLWETVGKMMTKRAIWYGLWNQKQIDAGPRTKQDFERMYRLCTEIAKAEAADIHVPHVGDACTFCDYSEQCCMEIPVAIAALDDPDDPGRWL